MSLLTIGDGRQSGTADSPPLQEITWEGTGQLAQGATFERAVPRHDH